MTEQISIGKYATLLTITDEQTAKQLMPQCHDMQFIVGKIGTMSLNKSLHLLKQRLEDKGLFRKVSIEKHTRYTMRF